MLEVLTYAFDESSDSSDDEEVAVLFLNALWPPAAEVSTAHRHRICLDRMSKFECERLFR